MNSTQRIQLQLVRKGFNPGPMDGINGPKTQNAFNAFSRAISPNDMLERAVVKASLMHDFDDGVDFDTYWIDFAMEYLGLEEIKGPHHNPKILEWWQKIGATFTDDETPWCAGFVGGILAEASLKNTGSAMARSYVTWGQGVPGPVFGAVVTFWRKSMDSPSGHVGFIVGKDQNDNLMVLGGNQGDEVNIKPFSRERVLSYRWPEGELIPPYGLNELPIVNSNGMVSENEQ